MSEMRSNPDSSRIIKSYSVLVSLMLIAAGIIGAVYTGEGAEVFSHLENIIMSPSKSQTDYFGYGSLGAAYINAGLLGLAVALLYIFIKAEAGAPAMTAYFLAIAHGFYGKNILNIWPCIIGTYLVLHLRKAEPRKLLHVCCFSSCFAPLVSELLYRYTVEEFRADDPRVTGAAVMLTVLCSFAVGLVFPPVLAFVRKLSGGYNLYSAGLAGGLIGSVLYLVLYIIPGREVHPAMPIYNDHYMLSGRSYLEFVNLVYASVAAVSLLTGRRLNGGSFEGYGSLLRSKEGVHAEKCGMARCLINIGVYGFFILAAYDMAVVVSRIIPEEYIGSFASFTGPTAGAMFAALSFACTAQSPKNTWPILSGYWIFGFMSLHLFDSWPLVSQSSLSSMAFATGLCPIVQKRGAFWGTAAGMIAAAICSFPSKLHGGFMVYNGGFTTGFVSLIMIVLFRLADGLKRKRPDGAENF